MIPRGYQARRTGNPRLARHLKAANRRERETQAVIGSEQRYWAERRLTDPGSCMIGDTAIWGDAAATATDPDRPVSTDADDGTGLHQGVFC